MPIDESQVTAAVAAVVDPELRRPLGELGMIGPVLVKRKRVAVVRQRRFFRGGGEEVLVARGMGLARHAPDIARGNVKRSQFGLCRREVF